MKGFIQNWTLKLKSNIIGFIKLYKIRKFYDLKKYIISKQIYQIHLLVYDNGCPHEEYNI